MSKKDFLNKYDEVFNEDGSIKLCGREKCKDLIIAAMALSNNSNTNYFGNEKTGMMNVPNIQTLKNNLI